MAGEEPSEGERLDLLEPERLKAIIELWRATGKRTEIPVQGRSMFPVLRPGWTLELDHCALDHPFGAIIVFLQGRLLVAHRVVGRTADGCYRTKGDALVHFDRKSASPGNVVGRVVAARHQGRVVRFDGRGAALTARAVALFSRAVGGLHRISRPLARLASASGRLPGSIPGPTRLLAALTRLGMRLAASRPQPPAAPPPGDSSSGAGEAPRGGS